MKMRSIDLISKKNSHVQYAFFFYLGKNLHVQHAFLSFLSFQGSIHLKMDWSADQSAAQTQLIVNSRPIQMLPSIPRLLKRNLERLATAISWQYS